MADIYKSYSMNGSLYPELMFCTFYGAIPCKYEYRVQIDVNQLDEKCLVADYIKKFFKNIDCVKEYSGKIIEGKRTETFPESFDMDDPKFMHLLDIESDASLIVAGDNKIVYAQYDIVTLYYDYNKEKASDMQKLAEEIYNSFPKAKQENKAAKVGLVKVSQDDYYVSFSEINRVEVNIEENYNDDFQPVYKDIVDFLDSRGSGLILLHGKVGTGKTNFIRHLCSTHPKDYVIIPNGIATRLGDPELISFLTACKNDVFILEDCEQLLVDRVDNPWNNAIATILNMADGLLSDVVNIKFICTFNADIDKIDGAILRKGRCFAKYEFKELTADKVDFLNQKYKLGIEEIKPMTLAEIYNSEKTDYSKQEVQKIGL